MKHLSGVLKVDSLAHPGIDPHRMLALQKRPVLHIELEHFNSIDRQIAALLAGRGRQRL